MNLEDTIKELQALIDKYSADDAEPTDEDASRMAELTKSITEIRAKQTAAAETRAATVAAARAAIESGAARLVDAVPLARSANASGTGNVYDVTDYKAAERRAWVKDVAERSGVQLYGGTTLTDVLFGDIRKDTFPNQYELVCHKSIQKGDAAKTAEGAAPADDEQNEFDTITLTGEEIKKTVKMSRKMAVQSIDGFEQYIVNETASRLSVACNAFVHNKLVDASLGMAAANKVESAKVKALSKADITGLLSKLYTYGNPAPKGCIVYANGNTIWNYIAMVEDANGRSYFVDEKTDDPSVEGHIFGKLVKRDDSVADNVIVAGYPDLVRGNLFDGPDVTPYVAQDGSQKRCFDGYVLFDCGLAVPQAFAQLTVKQA